MGQYYVACLLNKNYKKNKVKIVEDARSPWDYSNGPKLTEHSYVGNCFVAAAVAMLLNNTTQPFVWCGDYADELPDNESNVYNYAYENHFADKCSKNNPMTFEEAKKMDWYLLNHTKKEFVKIPRYIANKWQMHPLPLLTADGNGKGGGDYYGKGIRSVGRWKYDVIEAVKTKDKVPVNYQKITPCFTSKL